MPVTVIALLKDPNLVQTTYAEYWRKRVAREKFLGFTLVCPDLRIPENHGRRAYRSASRESERREAVYRSEMHPLPLDWRQGQQEGPDG